MGFHHAFVYLYLKGWWRWGHALLGKNKRIMCCSFDYVMQENDAVSFVETDFIQTACTMECRRVVVIPGYPIRLDLDMGKYQ